MATVGAEEPGDPTREGTEREVVDGDRVADPLPNSRTWSSPPGVNRRFS
jgi:hypothetical protein